MKIGIFGGTFDPIHLGHLELARSAQSQFSLDKIIFVPAFIPPHKTELKNLTSSRDRYEMVRLAIEGNSFFEISDCELARREVSYTIDTVKHLAAANPGAELYLILGQDTYEGMESWREPQEIRRRVQFLVAKRGKGHSDRTAGSGAYPIRMPLCPISASGIREAIKQGRKVDDYLPQAVLNYIQVHQLYTGS